MSRTAAFIAAPDMESGEKARKSEPYEGHRGRPHVQGQGNPSCLIRAFVEVLPERKAVRTRGGLEDVHRIEDAANVGDGPRKD